MASRRPSGAQRKGEAVRLVALLDGARVGEVYQLISGNLRFVYDEAWRTAAAAYPLSLSMPLTAREHGHDAINAFLWGLLPDTQRTLDYYGRLFGVSAGSAVGLLAHIGADCAGAVQLIAPDRIDELLAHNASGSRVKWLSEHEVAVELRRVREHGVAGDSPRTAGQFSLAGAQPKIALVEERGRWGRPSGRIPTNRILKPPSRDFAGFAENEHFCLELAAELGLGSVTSRVMRFEDEIAIVVDRFDRQPVGRRNVRVHQEDMCQARGIMPTRKYEADGGPGVAAIAAIVRQASRRPQDDVDRLLRICLFNWVIVATDAHAKNFALLHAAGSAVRLAPFYDIESYLPYAPRGLFRVKLAMRIGGEYLVRRIGRRQWERLAKEVAVAAHDLLARGADLLASLPGAVDRVSARALDDGLDAKVVDGLAALLRARIAECGVALGQRS